MKETTRPVPAEQAAVKTDEIRPKQNMTATVQYRTMECISVDTVGSTHHAERLQHTGRQDV